MGAFQSSDRSPIRNDSSEKLTASPNSPQIKNKNVRKESPGRAGYSNCCSCKHESNSTDDRPNAASARAAVRQGLGTRRELIRALKMEAGLRMRPDVDPVTGLSDRVVESLERLAIRKGEAIDDALKALHEAEVWRRKTRQLLMEIDRS